MTDIDFPFQAIKGLTFDPKPQPLPANLRPGYRIALIMLVLKTNCRDNAASLLKLQFFNWLLKSSSLQKFVQAKLSSQDIFMLELIHLDPMVNLALRYAFADNLISITKNSRYKLTEKGERFANQILQAKEAILGKEMEILVRIGQQVSEVKLRHELV